MAKFTNVSGIDLDLPAYGLHVPKDAIFEVPDDAEPDFAGQTALFAPVADAAPAPDPVPPETSEPADPASEPQPEEGSNA